MVINDRYGGQITMSATRINCEKFSRCEHFVHQSLEDITVLSNCRSFESLFYLSYYFLFSFHHN